MQLSATRRTSLDLAARLALPVLVLLVGEPGDATAEALRHPGEGRGWMVAPAHDARSMGVAIERALAAGRPALLDARV